MDSHANTTNTALVSALVGGEAAEPGPAGLAEAPDLKLKAFRCPWSAFGSGRRYRMLGVVERSDSAFVAYASRLPGAASEGDSPEEALENLKEAAAACIESYRAAGENIPWTNGAEGESDAVVLKRWIAVDV